MSAKKEIQDDVLARNKKAFHDYSIVDTYEAGVELRGTEVKSCRAHSISPADSFVRIERGQAFMYNLHIAPYENGNIFNHDSRRPRRLLLHKKEILKIAGQIKERGLTVVPLKFFLKHGRVKVEIGLAKGKTHEDKRDTLRRKQDEMDTKRVLASKRYD